MSILIKGGTLVTMNPERDITASDILIEGDLITKIGPISPNRADQVINAQGMLVIPGLVQSHVHLCQALFRGLANDMELLEWLNRRIFPLEAAHDEESLYYSAMLGCAELLRGGTTSIIDMGTVRHTNSIFAAAARAGIRYLGGNCMVDIGSEGSMALVEPTEAALQKSLDLLQKWDGKAEGRLHYAFCPRFVPACSQELLAQMQALSARYDIPVHTHASENKSEIKLVETQRCRRNVVYLNDLGLCNEKLILAHCIHISGEEKGILASTGTNVAHCPSSNLKLASGIAPIPELINCGAAVSLGADGAPCNDNMSMFMEMRLAALIQKPLHGATSMPAQTVFEMATLGGARAMGRENELGSLEAGKKADLALIDLNQWHIWPLSGADVYGQLVYQVQTRDVCCTIVNGQVLMLEGELLAIDENEVKTKSAESRDRVRKRAGLL
ncbi:MAG: 5'-deoxyadenosine deaminase [Syntrophomonadaceae bacterium]|nr:5'-deoxyadenosine deaminase [Syntrophomonadaceae bacterium]